MHESVIAWFNDSNTLSHAEIYGKRVIEIGSCDVNGSIQPVVLAHEPREYVGVDRTPGPRVDQVIDCEKLISTFGLEQFDVAVTTEMLEHVEDWQTCIRNIIAVLRVGGLLFLTTRSVGFPRHEYPYDFWRYSREAIAAILARSGMTVLLLESDPQAPGIFCKAEKIDGGACMSARLDDVRGVTPMGPEP